LENLTTYVESLIFAAEAPISRTEIRLSLENSFETSISESDIEDAISELYEKYNDPGFAFEVREIDNGFVFLTKPAYHHIIGSYLKLNTRKKLSRVALESLAIIAYKQPVTKSELEKIRGVNCDYVLQKLMEKDLVEITGRADGPGKPLLYSTSSKFMEYFGLKDLSDLPKLRDIREPDQQIGEPAPIEEDSEEPRDH
jgi:segregation and condensation protein B